jgi:alanyl-tRNA synthetase
MDIFNQELQQTKDIFSGDIAFKLYDTYGFPLDLTQDMLRDKGLQVDQKRFDELMQQQRTKAKSAWKGSGDKAKDGDFKKILETVGKNQFIGYEHTSSKSKIVALLDENFNQVDMLKNNTIGWVMLDKTPFYATSGGQSGDTGVLEDKRHIAQVLSTEKFFDLNLSKVKIIDSTLKVGESVDAIVVQREEIAKHHSATHLLQSALKIVLSDTVAQAGSLNDSTRLRFDFTYPKAMTEQQIGEVEDLVNSMIAHSIDSNIEELPIEEAKTKGAIAMFGEKYGDIVRVVQFGDVSTEFCGGTHVKNTSEIGSFYIVKESGVSAGVRRIEAVCGMSAIKYAKSFMTTVNELSKELKTNDLKQGVTKLKDQIKKLKTELANASQNINTELNEQIIGDTKVVVDIVNQGDLKKLVDDLKNGNDKIAILLLQQKGDKVMLVAGSKNSSIKAGDWIKQIAPIVGGGGGGRADFAQAGGKNPSKIQEAKTKALEYLKTNL